MQDRRISGASAEVSSNGNAAWPLGVATSYWVIIFHCSFQGQNPNAMSPAANAAAEMSTLVVNPDADENLEMDRAPMMLHPQGSGGRFD